jgi:flagellar motor component MotA
MFQLHVEGGMEWMAPLSLLLIINIGLSVFLLIRWFAQHQQSERMTALIRQVGMFALAFGVLGTVSALFMAFGSLSEIPEPLPLAVIMGGMKVALITALYGLIIFLISLCMYTFIRFVTRPSSVD